MDSLQTKLSIFVYRQLLEVDKAAGLKLNCLVESKKLNYKLIFMLYYHKKEIRYIIKIFVNKHLAFTPFGFVSFPAKEKKQLPSV